MVTNERQRQYAIESRKGSGSTPSLEERANVFRMAETVTTHQDQAQYSNGGGGPSPYHGSTNMFEANPSALVADHHQSPSQSPASKRQKIMSNHNTPEVHDDSAQTLTPPSESTKPAYIVHTRSFSDADDMDIELQVEILGSSSTPRGSKQTHQSIRASSATYPTFESFSTAMIEASHKLIPHGINEHDSELPAQHGTEAAAQKKPRTECHLETGLVEIENDNEYQSALETVRNTIWMGRSLRVILRW